MSPVTRAKITTGVLTAVFVWLLLLVAGAQLRYGSGRRQLDAMEDRISGAQRENERLGQELSRMKQPAWLTILARARLNYKQADENVVFVYKSEKSGTISQPQPMSDDRPNWKKWRDWIGGK
jgi:hypothetical protein